MEGSDCNSDEPDNQSMTTISHHLFGDDLDKPVFSISIIEVLPYFFSEFFLSFLLFFILMNMVLHWATVQNMKEEYGLYVWPCSIVLAEYVWQHRLRFSSGSTVLEVILHLGAGTCLPGLVAAKVGAHVTLTDNASRLEVLDNMTRVCDVNHVNSNVVGLTWGVWDLSIFNLHPKIILGADVLYDNSAFDDLFSTVKFLLQNSPGAVFITTYHNRSGHHLIEFLMVKWGLKCVKLVDGFSFMPFRKSSGLSGNIQLAEIVLNS